MGQSMSQTRYIQPLEPRTLLSVTAPDPSFGNGGSVKVPADEALGVLPDEKILSVGDVSEGVDGGYVDTIVSRLNPDGTLDSSFGTAGQLKFKRSNFSSSLV